MRLGIISDTHGLLRPEVYHVFAGVEHILHAGDVGNTGILADLQALAPVTAVYGNTDGAELRRTLPAVATLQLDGFDIVVTHGDQFGSPTPDALYAAFPEAQIIIYGHTHKPLLTVVDVVVTLINPGGAGPRRFKLPPTVGILELEAGIPPRGRIVPLLDFDSE